MQTTIIKDLQNDILQTAINKLRSYRCLSDIQNLYDCLTDNKTGLSYDDYDVIKDKIINDLNRYMIPMLIKAEMLDFAIYYSEKDAIKEFTEIFTSQNERHLIYYMPNVTVQFLNDNTRDLMIAFKMLLIDIYCNSGEIAINLINELEKTR